MALDLVILNWVHGLAGWSVFTDTVGIFLAKYLPYLLGLPVLVFVFQQNNWKFRVKVFLGLALAALISRGIVTEAIRFLYDRPRPFTAFGFSPLVGEGGASFPSGHAAFFFALGFVIFSINRRWGYWFLSLSLLNGLARIFAGVHYPSDILGGILVGLAGWAIVRFLLKDKNIPETVSAMETKTGDGPAV